MNTITNFFGIGTHWVRIVILPILTCLTISNLYAQLTNAGYSRDVSISASVVPFDAKTTFKKIVGMTGLKDSKIGVNLYTSVIGAPGIPKVNVTSLPAEEGYFNSVHERNANLSHFFQKGIADFEDLAQPATHKQTQIFRSVVAMTSQFAPGAERTILIIESDFIESGPVAEFFKYQNNSSALMDDFDKIMEAFKQDSELPDLTGAEVILVTPADSELAVWSVRWWKKAMFYFGAKEVVIKATL